MKRQVKINNFPEYAWEKKFVVVHIVDGEMWFWGAWDDYEKATAAAQATNGVIV